MKVTETKLPCPQVCGAEPSAENLSCAIKTRPCLTFEHQSPELVRLSLELSQALSVSPHQHGVIVGGFIRDEMLGKRAADLDMAALGWNFQELQDHLSKVFPGRVHVRTKVPPLLFISDQNSDGCELRCYPEQGEFRIDSGVASRPPPPFLASRNFSVNAIAFDPASGNLWDPFGGAEDLAARRLVPIQKNLFEDEPINLLKVVQQAARFELAIPPEVQQQMHAASEKIDWSQLNPGVVKTQIAKILLESEKPSIAFELLRSAGVLEKFMPELHALIGCPQNPKHHPEGDVWTHTMLVVDAAAKLIRSEGDKVKDPLAVMLAALCHDIGKPACNRIKNGEISSPGHEQVSGKLSKALLERIGIGGNTSMIAMRMIYGHMRLGEIERRFPANEATDRFYSNELRKLCRDISPASFGDFSLLCLADQQGRGQPPPSEWPSLERAKNRVESEGIEALSRTRLTNGKDLTAMGIESPQFGLIIQEVERRRDNGQLFTPEDALKFVRSHFLISPGDIAEVSKIVEPKQVGQIMATAHKLLKDGELRNRHDVLKWLKDEAKA